MYGAEEELCVTCVAGHLKCFEANHLPISGLRIKGTCYNFFGTHKQVNIVAETMFPKMFPLHANKETFAEEAKCF